MGQGQCQCVDGQASHCHVYKHTAISNGKCASQRDGSRISVPCPEAILSYNAHMGGVDQGDQLRGYYSCRTKSRKFYKYIFYFLFDASITNSFILWKTFGSATGMTFKEFQLRLAQQLIGDYCVTFLSNSRMAQQVLTREDAVHAASKFTINEQTQRGFVGSARSGFVTAECLQEIVSFCGIRIGYKKIIRLIYNFLHLYHRLCTTHPSIL